MRSALLNAVACLALYAGPAVGQQQPAAPAADAPPAATAADAASGTVTLELNKLMPAGDTCQIYFVVDNQTPQALQELTVDMYMFDEEGVILRGLALQFADLRARRETVVPFELPDLACGDISRVLLNNVLTCTNAEGAAVPACAEMVAVSTRADAAFEY